MSNSGTAKEVHWRTGVAPAPHSKQIDMSGMASGTTLPWRGIGHDAQTASLIQTGMTNRSANGTQLTASRVRKRNSRADLS